ncbi:MAG: dihydroorotase [Saprospiraceae bacterium]|nr:dihydroorotase [Saprospiraceae bacterium]
MHLLLKQVKIIDPTSSHHGQIKDVLVRNGKIDSIRKSVPGKFSNLLQQPGLMISPGWMDVGAFIGDPGLEHIETMETAAVAAAAGGFTCVVMLPNTNPALQSKSEIEYIHNRSRSMITTILPFGALTKGCHGKEMAELVDMYHAGAVAFTDGINSIQEAGVMLRGLEYVKTFDGIVANHPDTHDIGTKGMIHEGSVSVSLGLVGKPDLAEALMVKRDIDLLRYSGSQLHILNISSAKSVKLIREAKQEGLRITCSVPVMNLVDTEAKLLTFNSNLKVKPPLRSETDRATLVNGIVDGTIDFITSNHRPVEIERKKLEFAYADFGAIGLQTVFPLLQHGLGKRKKVDRMVHLLSIAPRKFLGIPIPSIERGNPAEITIFHPDKKWMLHRENVHSKSQNSAYMEMSLKGASIGVVNRGKIRIWSEAVPA